MSNFLYHEVAINIVHAAVHGEVETCFVGERDADSIRPLGLGHACSRQACVKLTLSMQQMGFPEGSAQPFVAHPRRGLWPSLHLYTVTLLFCTLTWPLWPGQQQARSHRRKPALREVSLNSPTRYSRVTSGPKSSAAVLCQLFVSYRQPKANLLDISPMLL